MAPSTGSPETNGPTADQACQLVTIRVEYGNATIIGWTLVETGDNELLFDEGTYVDSFYSSDPDVASSHGGLPKERIVPLVHVRRR